MLLTANGITPVAVDAGREYVISAAGTFGGGTLTPKWSDGVNDVTVTGPSGDITLTGAGAYIVVVPTGLLKIVLTGAASPSITASVTARSK
jgi:hypothetical protein